MNQRIQELADQCWGDFFNKEKFAELLIRECAKIADIAEPWRSSDLILDYFGVPNDQP